MELNQLHYPFAEQAILINGFALKERKKAYIALTRTFSESKYQRVQDKSEMIEKCRVWTRVLQPYLNYTAVKCSTETLHSGAKEPDGGDWGIEKGSLVSVSFNSV